MVGKAAVVLPLARERFKYGIVDQPPHLLGERRDPSFPESPTPFGVTVERLFRLVGFDSPKVAACDWLSGFFTCTFVPL